MPPDEPRYRSFSACDASPIESQYLGVVEKYSVGGTGSRISGRPTGTCPGWLPTGIRKPGRGWEGETRENAWSAWTRSSVLTGVRYRAII